MLRHSRLQGAAAGGRRAFVALPGPATTARPASLVARGVCVARFSAHGRLPAAAAAAARPAARRRGRAVSVRAVFERFSERAIKSVMIAQSQAKDLGASEVRTGAGGARTAVCAMTAPAPTWQVAVAAGRRGGARGRRRWPPRRRAGPRQVQSACGTQLRGGDETPGGPL
jgi:hypothetical protein